MRDREEDEPTQPASEPETHEAGSDARPRSRRGRNVVTRVNVARAVNVARDGAVVAVSCEQDAPIKQRP